MARISILMLLLSGCAVYDYQHVNANGSSTRMKIYSTREVQAADLKIDKHGALSGGAEKLGANERLLELLSTAIKKIP